MTIKISLTASAQTVDKALFGLLLAVGLDILYYELKPRRITGGSNDKSSWFSLFAQLLVES